MNSTRLVVLGGTFDPIHVGHIALLRGAVELLDATQGVLVVEHGHRHRSAAVASHADRRHLVHLAIADDPSLVEAGQLGIDAGLAEVVDRLSTVGHEVHVVFGSDSAHHLDRWNGRELLAAATLWSVTRHGEPADDISGISALPLTVPTLSATQIRSTAAAGRLVRTAVPAPCRTAVEALYGPPHLLAEEVFPLACQGDRLIHLVDTVLTSALREALEDRLAEVGTVSSRA